jgi:type I restriction enzyme S subunit
MTTNHKWECTNLGSVTTFTNGGAWKASEYVESGITVIRVTDCKNGTIDMSACKHLPEESHNKYKKHQLLEGDLVVATVGSHPTQPNSVVGRPIIVTKEAAGAFLNQNAVCIRPIQSSIINKRFLSHLAKAPFFSDYIISCARGTANQVRMAIGLLKEMPIELPPLTIQHKIAAILSTYDNLIENNTKRISILEEMAQTIYNEWFVKFRFPGHENVKMVESELGIIPDGWEVKKLSDTCNVLMGQSPKSEFYNEIGEGLPFHQGVTNFGDRFPIDSKYCTKPQRIAEAGDILFSVRAPVGRINITDKKIVIGRGLCAIRNNSSNQNFTFHQLRDRFKEEDLMGGGTIFKAVTKADMCGIKLVYPSESIIESFETIINPLSSQIKTLTYKNSNLSHTRALLLPRLISGEINVSDLDIKTGMMNNGS